METQFEELNFKEENRKVKHKKKFSGKTYNTCAICKTTHLCKKCKGLCIFSHDFLTYVKPSFRGMLNEKYYKPEVEMIEMLIANPDLQIETKEIEKKSSSREGSSSSESEDGKENSKQEKSKTENKKCKNKILEEEIEKQEEEQVDESAYKKMAEIITQYHGLTKYAQKYVNNIHHGIPISYRTGGARGVHASSGFAGNVVQVTFQHPRNEKLKDENRTSKNQEINHLYLKEVKID